MSERGRDPEGNGGLDTEHLRASLREKSYDELARELSQRLSRERIGGETDELVDLYLEIMGEKTPLCHEVDPAEELAEFHRRLAAQEIPEERPPRKVRRISPRRLMTAAILLVLALVLGGYATGFQWPKFLVIWQEEILLIQPSDSGQMELPELDPNNYRSLRAALDAYELPHVDPKWIPGDFSISEVAAAEMYGRIDIFAAYTDIDNREIIVRIVAMDDAPTIAYEKNNDGKKNIYTTNEVEFQLTGNVEQSRATWVMEDCYCSIAGDITEEQLILMMESIFKE